MGEPALVVQLALVQIEQGEAPLGRGHLGRVAPLVRAEQRVHVLLELGRLEEAAHALGGDVHEELAAFERQQLGDLMHLDSLDAEGIDEGECRAQVRLLLAELVEDGVDGIGERHVHGLHPHLGRQAAAFRLELLDCLLQRGEPPVIRLAEQEDELAARKEASTVAVVEQGVQGDDR